MNNIPTTAKDFNFLTSFNHEAQSHIIVEEDFSFLLEKIENKDSILWDCFIIFLGIVIIGFLFTYFDVSNLFHYHIKNVLFRGLFTYES